MKRVCSSPVLLTPDGASVSSYSIKPLRDFESFLSCDRLLLLAVGSGRAPFCFFVLPRAVAVLEPSMQGLLLFPAALVKIRQPVFFFLNFALDFVPLEMSLIFHFIQQPTFIRPVGFSAVKPDTSDIYLPAFRLLFNITLLFSLPPLNATYFFCCFHIITFSLALGTPQERDH